MSIPLIRYTFLVQKNFGNRRILRTLSNSNSYTKLIRNKKKLRKNLNFFFNLFILHFVYGWLLFGGMQLLFVYLHAYFYMLARLIQANFRKSLRSIPFIMVFPIRPYILDQFRINEKWRNVFWANIKLWSYHFQVKKKFSLSLCQ